MFLPIPIKWQRKTCRGKWLCNYTTPQQNLMFPAHRQMSSLWVLVNLTTLNGTTWEEHWSWCVCMWMLWSQLLAELAGQSAGLETQESSMGEQGAAERNVMTGAQVLVRFFALWCNQLSYAQNTCVKTLHMCCYLPCISSWTGGDHVPVF